MSRSPFGWHYPAGAENDPNAPWNLPDADEPVKCKTCKRTLDEVDGNPCGYCEARAEAAYEARMEMRREDREV